jgi:ABC-type transporter MlaC component
MKRKFLFIITLLALFKTSLADGYSNAKTDYEKFLNESVGRMLRISKMKTSSERQAEEMENLLFECVDIEKASKRVLGRAKWQTLNEDEQKTFLVEYPKYFISSFKDIILIALQGVEDFKSRKLGNQNSFLISLQYADKSKKNLEIVLDIEEKNGELKITDGKFAEISIINSQRQMFAMLYDQNPKSIKEFRAEKYITKK